MTFQQTNNVTLKYLTNPYYQNVMTSRNNQTIKDNEMLNNESSVTKEDISFYRKRIVALTKEMLKGTVPNKDIKKEHDEYVRHMINYFKMGDRNDILQKQYAAEDDNSKTEKDNAIDNDMIDISGIELEKVNELMMKKMIKIANLDDFVIIANNKKENDDRIIPIKKEIDLKTPNLRIKGIKKKMKK